MQFERVWDRPPFAVDHLDGTGGDLVIAFASVGRDPARPPAPEFVATATGRGTRAFPRRALFVSDASRSWTTDPGFAPALTGALATLARRAPVARILTIGLSMGGVAALAAARVLPVDAVLAFGPQADPHLPGETRWRHWTARLPPIARAGTSLPDRGRVWLFHGAADDMAQARAFPAHPRTDALIFPGLGHSDLVPHLKARGVLAGLVEAGLAGDRRRVLRIAGSAGGLRRRPMLAPRPDPA